MSAGADVELTLTHLLPLPADSDAFLRWALGDDYAGKKYEETPALWNARHGAQLSISGFGTPQTDLPQMVELWRAAAAPTRDTAAPGEKL